MKRVLSIIIPILITVSASASGLGFHEGVDDNTVLFKDMKKKYCEWHYTQKEHAQRMFDKFVANGADPNKTVSNNGLDWDPMRHRYDKK